MLSCRPPCCLLACPAWPGSGLLWLDQLTALRAHSAPHTVPERTVWCPDNQHVVLLGIVHYITINSVVSVVNMYDPNHYGDPDICVLTSAAGDVMCVSVILWCVSGCVGVLVSLPGEFYHPTVPGIQELKITTRRVTAIAPLSVRANMMVRSGSRMSEV